MNDRDWLPAPAPATPGDGPQVEFEGTVQYFEMEGGFFAIRGEDSTTYDPTNLPDSLKSPGTRVRVVAKRRDDLMGFHAVGPIVDVVRYQVLDAPGRKA
jgi:hypothetical protein